MWKTKAEFETALRRYFGLSESVNVADSYNALMSEVGDALHQWTGRPAQDMSVMWTFADRIIAYEWVEPGDSRTWEIPWSRNEAGAIIFGTAVEVERVETYEPLGESVRNEKRFVETVGQRLVSLSEGQDGARRVKAIGITADVVNGNNRRYPRAVLAAAVNCV